MIHRGIIVRSPEFSSISFSGLSHGTGPMTWPQRAIWSVVHWEGENAHHRNLPCVWELPGRIGERDVVRAFEALIARWETLRTTYETGDGRRRQIVHGRGEVPLHLYRTTPDRVEDCAQEAVRELRRRTFDLALDMPLRLGVVSARGEAVRAIAVFSHVAVDGWSMNILRGMFTEVLHHGPAALDRYAGLAEQPLERAEFEQSAAGARLDRRTLDFWRRSFREAPAIMISGGPEKDARIERAKLHSHDMARAVGRIAGNGRAGNAALIYGAASLVLAAALDITDLAVRTLTVTRFRRQARYSIAALNLNGLYRLTIEGGTVGEYFRRSAVAAIRALEHSQCDPEKMERELDAILRDRGESLRQCVFFNNMAQVVETAVGDQPQTGPDSCCDGVTRCERIPDDEPDRDSKFLLMVVRADAAVDLELYLDRRFFPVTAIDFLMAVERVLREAADDSNADLGVLTGHCREWIEGAKAIRSL